MRLLLALVLLALLPPAGAALFSGSAVVLTGGLLLFPIARWPAGAPASWSRVGLPGHPALTLSAVSVFARDQRCLDASGAPRPCGRDALSHALVLFTDPTLVCVVARSAVPVPAWLPDPVPPSGPPPPGRAVLALPARCSTATLADVSVALVRAGHAIPRAALPASHPARAALVAARAASAGVWAYAPASGFVAPSFWEANRLASLPDDATP